MPQQAREYDVQGALKGRRCVTKYERHSGVSVCAHVAGERRLVPSLLRI